MGNGGDRLHFNGVHLLERVIENSRCVNGLKAKHLVIEMAHEQGLRGESVRLHIDIGSGDVAKEGGFAHIWVTTDKKCAGVRVDRRQSAQMLSNLFKVDERIPQALTDGRHTSECCPLELLALEE